MSGDLGLWGGTVGPRCSDRVWPPSGTPFLWLACQRPSQRPEPQPTAEPEQPAAPRARVARTLSRQPAHTACSPTTSLTPQPPQGHRLPSASPARPQARPHLPATVPLQPRAIPHTPCPALAFTSAGLPPAPQTHPCHPPTPTADLSQPHTGAWHGVATASMLLQRPCSSGRPILRPGPRESHASPFPPALHADATPKHPWACLPAPCSLPPPLPAMALPRSLILVGHPPAMAPGSFVPHSHPRTLTPTAPAGASRKPPAAMASTRQATGSPFAQGTQLCPVAPERAALAAGWCPSSAVHSPTPPPKGHSPSTVVKPFGVTDGLKIGLRGDCGWR